MAHAARVRQAHNAAKAAAPLQAQRPRTKAKATTRIVVFDIETEAWDKFVCGALYTEEGCYQEFWQASELWDALWNEGLERGTEIYAWNGGRYDFLWGLEVARARGCFVEETESEEIEASEQEVIRGDIGLAGTRITSVRWKTDAGKGPTWKDACALIPMSLRKASAIAGVDAAKEETGLRCRCGEDCGGYCSIRRTGMSRAERLRLSEYLRNDCQVTLRVVRAVRTEAELSGYIVKGTVGATGYATAKKICGFDDAEWTPARYHLTRSGYFGGRVECVRPRMERGHGHDIVSAYPAALSVLELPVGENIVVAGARAERAFGRRKEGIYEADVFVPDLFIPPLPVRAPSGERVLFPVGPVSGAWTRIELQHAIESGCEVKRWGRAIVWAEREAICAPFMDQVWARRQKAIEAGNEGLKEWHKLVGNSFTGKCAQNPEMERVLFNPDTIKRCGAVDCRYSSRDACERRKHSDRCCLHECTRKCGAYYQLGGADSPIWTSEYFRIPDCGHVHWSAYLTAHTRVEWRKQALSDGVGGRTVSYGDTDSLITTTKRTRRMGASLGEWKYEGALVDWRCVALKAYRYERELPVGVHGPRLLITKAKGLPELDGASWDQYAAGIGVPRERGVKSLKSAARGASLFTRKRITRKSLADGRWFGGRLLATDGLTYPVTIEEFEHVEERV